MVIYSRTSIIRSTYSGLDKKSTAFRRIEHQNHLNQHLKSIHVIVLQGFVFFGTLHQLDAYINTIIEEIQMLSYVIIDFEEINGIDYSATSALLKIKSITKENEIQLLLCGLKRQDESFMKIEKSGIHDDSCITIFENVDNALEWCENDILKCF